MALLTDLVSIRTGYVRGRFTPDTDGAFAVVEPKHINNRGLIETNTIDYAAELDPPDHHQLRVGDVLFVPRGPRHPAAQVQRGHVNGPLRRAVASSQLYILRTDDRLLPAYLTWYLNQEQAQSYFQTFGRGATIASINQQILRELPLPVPSRARQARIVQIAQLADKETRLAQQLQQKRATLIQTLLHHASQ